MMKWYQSGEKNSSIEKPIFSILGSYGGDYLISEIICLPNGYIIRIYFPAEPKWLTSEIMAFPLCKLVTFSEMTLESALKSIIGSSI